MYKVIFYKDRNGRQPAAEYIAGLKANDSKTNRIKLNKIFSYLNALKSKGTWAGEHFMKHLNGEIWELRPLDDRFLFAAWYRDSFVILHCFKKDTAKTPREEIERAKRELADIKERGMNCE